MCLLNRSSDGLSVAEGQVADDHDVMRRLSKFTNKHRSLLLAFALQALELWTDPSRSHKYAFVVYLRIREGSTKPEQYFYATSAEVALVDSLVGIPSGRHQTLREDIEAESERVKQFGMTGSFLVVLMAWDVKQGGITMNKVFCPFDANRLESPGQIWKQSLFVLLNNGLLL
ncbi:hypothetical protein NLI96_g5171 [Meripilus lineatus]|uniref:Uncharacterized protein n=1 Tax=Meripilus lineatus TaxID=2056292 RepID=A0AAD5YH65_9APHY|nr:hypothetical protein NLI96_g5171 [Physisporinus lineatus]